MENAYPATSPATGLPPKILIRICSFNALPNIWDRYVQKVDEDAVDGDFGNASEDIDEDGDAGGDWEDGDAGGDWEDVDENEPPIRVSPIRNTINASHVCRTWRTILLSAPELWCRMIDPYNASLSKIMLERSQALGIAFSLPLDKEEQGRNEEDLEREMAPEYVNRLTEYQFKCHFFLDAGPQSHYIRGSMNARYFPMLKDLSISFPSHSELPHKFPGKGMPKLQRLHLHQCFFPGVSHLTTVDKTLVHLHIDHTSLTEDVLVDTLRSLPALKCLILERAFDHAAQAPVKLCSDNFLCLSQLQELRIIDAHSSRAASFLGRISITRTLSIFCLELDFPNLAEKTDLVLNARLFQQLSWILSGMTASEPLSSLRIACRRGVTFCPDSSTMRHGVPPGKSHLIPIPQRCFHVQFTPPQPYSQNEFLLSVILFVETIKKSPWRDFISQFHGTIGNLGAYSQARHLVIPGFKEDVDEEVAARTLRQCQGVTVLQAVSLSLWELLCDLDATDGLEDSKDYVLPNLEELSFSGLDIIPERGSDRKLDPPGDDLDEELTGALWLARPLSPDGDKPDSSAEDPDFEYESGQSDWEDEPDTFVQDLLKFCKKRKNLRVVFFSEIDEEVLAECKRILLPLEVDVI